MEIKADREPLVIGHLKCNGKSYRIKCFTWLSFMMRINEMMSEQEIIFPIGEDSEMRMVTKKVKNTERYRK